MKEKVIRKEEFITTKWVGGETTQLMIYPEDAVFSNKDFLWRISSASFTSTESVFSDFTGYQRYILPLQGELELKHKGLYERSLKKFDVEYFDGSWKTSSRNTPDCRDFNFIVKSGNLAKMQILSVGEEYVLKTPVIATLFSTESFEIDIENQDQSREIEGFSLYVLEAEHEEKIRIVKAKNPVIVTEFAL